MLSLILNFSILLSIKTVRFIVQSYHWLKKANLSSFDDQT